VVEQTVIEELQFGRLRGRSDADIAERLAADGVIEIGRLGTGGLIISRRSSRDRPSIRWMMVKLPLSPLPLKRVLYR
jgi:hypothetical protein